MQNGDAAFRAKFRLAGIARIEKQNPADRLAKLFVRVAEDDRIRFFAREPRLQFVRRRVRIDDVMDEEFFICE